MNKKAIENDVPDVYLDFNGTISILRKRGVEANLGSTAKELGYSEQGFIKLRNNTPKVISVIHRYLKDNMLKFEDLVKVREKK